MKRFSIYTFTCIALTLSMASAGEALNLAGKFEREKIAALEEYLKQNPEAEDKGDAIVLLIDAHRAIEDVAGRMKYLQMRYDFLNESNAGEFDLVTVMREVVRPCIEAGIEGGQRAEAKSFAEKVKADMETLSPAERDQALAYIEKIAAPLDLPGVGDSIDFTLTATDGETVDLSKTGDSVVLVDFWATWCGPCVAEIPNLKKNYAAYHDKGFEIIGVSLDTEKNQFESFVRDKDLPWRQCFDGKGWENDLVRRLKINAIPAVFLVQNGKIIAANLRGDELGEFLEDHFKN